MTRRPLRETPGAARATPNHASNSTPTQRLTVPNRRTPARGAGRRAARGGRPQRRASPGRRRRPEVPRPSAAPGSAPAPRRRPTRPQRCGSRTRAAPARPFFPSGDPARPSRAQARPRSFRESGPLDCGRGRAAPAPVWRGAAATRAPVQAPVPVTGAAGRRSSLGGGLSVRRRRRAGARGRRCAEAGRRSSFSQSGRVTLWPLSESVGAAPHWRRGGRRPVAAGVWRLERVSWACAGRPRRTRAPQAS
ncbi:unnamed protein product [Pelagomonas calceolata]|uniref:Uncharacterized protein n=1 Tax=Pelagomonas calceolata TaxID=35677 RepID=A0A8J2WQ03_9STRA|nr:unnamed protein product [Pelagomonas calceolata]